MTNRNMYTVMFRDKRGHILMAMTCSAKDKDAAIANAIAYGHPPPYHTVTAE